jgi:hypothetical protein
MNNKMKTRSSVDYHHLLVSLSICIGALAGPLDLRNTGYVTDQIGQWSSGSSVCELFTGFPDYFSFDVPVIAPSEHSDSLHTWQNPSGFDYFITRYTAYVGICLHQATRHSLPHHAVIFVHRANRYKSPGNDHTC